MYHHTTEVVIVIFRHYLTIIHLVGSTIHMLSKGLDSGSILYHAMSKVKSSPFDYTMSTVKSAFHSIVEKIKDESILDLKPEKQDKLKKLDIQKVLSLMKKLLINFLKKIDLNVKDFDNSLLKTHIFLKVKLLVNFYYVNKPYIDCLHMILKVV